MNTQKGVIYFDGLCLVCSTEISHYQKLPGSENFEFVDITDIEFDPKIHGLDPQRVHKVMHVRDLSGKLYEGIDAFKVIWRQLPKYQFLARASENFIVSALLKFFYQAFVKLRPYLPRKKLACADSPYCERPRI